MNAQINNSRDTVPLQKPSLHLMTMKWYQREQEVDRIHCCLSQDWMNILWSNRRSKYIYSFFWVLLENALITIDSVHEAGSARSCIKEAPGPKDSWGLKKSPLSIVVPSWTLGKEHPRKTLGLAAVSVHLRSTYIRYQHGWKQSL